MREFQILQIGDIHFSRCKGITNYDDQDKSYPESLKKLIAQNILESIVRELSKCLNIDAIIFCGDLSCGGDQTEYLECVQYLVSALSLANSNKPIIVVPGNHDIDHDLVNNTNPLLRYEKLNSAWKDIKGVYFATDSIKCCKTNEKNLNLFSINSCLGCGEHRFPDEIKVFLENAIEKAKRGSDNEKCFELKGELIDTPMFSNSHIDELVSNIKSTSKESLPIIVTHHNLLPQAIPRIKMYSEIINAGQLRSRLLAQKRNVIYCHGHIHDNPVEIMSKGDNKPGNLICISAPKLIDGYNLIKTMISDKGIPMGLEIILNKWINRIGEIESEEVFRIPLVKRHNFDAKSNTEINELLAILDGQYKRFEEIVNNLKKSEDIVSKYIREAKWYGLVVVSDYDEETKYWQVKIT